MQKYRGAVLAVLLGVFLTLEMFGDPLSVAFAADAAGRSSKAHQNWALGQSLVPLVNLVIGLAAGAFLVRSAPALRIEQRACLLMTSVAGTSLVGASLAIWLATVKVGWQHPTELVPGWPSFGIVPLFHGLLVIAWLRNQFQAADLQSKRKAKGAVWGLTIALAFWILASQFPNSPLPLVCGLTAMIYATALAGGLQVRPGETSRHPENALTDAPAL